MKTISGVLYFLNKLDFIGYLENHEYEKFCCIRKVLTSEIKTLFQRG